MLTRRKFLATAAAVPLLPSLAWAAKPTPEPKSQEWKHRFNLDKIHIEYWQDVQRTGRYYVAGQTNYRVTASGLKAKDTRSLARFVDSLSTNPIADPWVPKGKQLKSRGTSKMFTDGRDTYGLTCERSGDPEAVFYWLCFRLHTLQRYLRLSDEVCQAIEQHFPWKVPNAVKALL